MNKLASETAIHYWAYNIEGQLPVVVCIHGHGGDHRGLEKLAESMSHRTYCVDLPGFGESPELEEHSLKALADSIKNMATDLSLESYVVLGHSLGSAIALELAAKDSRVVKLILVNPIPTFSKFMEKLIIAVGGASQKIPEPYAQKLIHAHLYNLTTFLLHSRNRGDTKHLRSYLKQQADATYSLKAWHETGTAIYESDQMALAKRIKVPTLLLHGERDSMTTSEALHEFKDCFLNARMQFIPKAGHLMPIENYQEAASEINEFLLHEPKVKTLSIVIPCLNEAGVVEALLNQLVEQNDERIEVIAVDNSSADNTPKILHSFEKYGFKAAVGIKRGVSRARNAGAKLAQGEWLLFLDADNQIPDKFVSDLLSLLEKKPQVQLAAVGYRAKTRNLWFKVLSWNGQAYQRLSSKFGKSPLVPGAFTLVKRNLHEKVGGFNEAIKYNEDFDYSKRVYQICQSYNAIRKPYIYMSVRRLEGGGWRKMAKIYFKAELARIRGKEYHPDEYDLTTHKMR